MNKNGAWESLTALLSPGRFTGVRIKLRNQVFRSRVLIGASKMRAIAHVWDAKGLKTWFLAASTALSQNGNRSPAR